MEIVEQGSCLLSSLGKTQCQQLLKDFETDNIEFPGTTGEIDLGSINVDRNNEGEACTLKTPLQSQDVQSCSLPKTYSGILEAERENGSCDQQNPNHRLVSILRDFKSHKETHFPTCNDKNNELTLDVMSKFRNINKICDYKDICKFLDFQNYSTFGCKTKCRSSSKTAGIDVRSRNKELCSLKLNEDIQSRVSSIVALSLSNRCDACFRNDALCCHYNDSERNNSNTADLSARRTPSGTSYRDCQFSGRVIHVEGDGRCLFRSLSTCRTSQLQKAIRDEYGCPTRQEDAALETNMADELRQQVVKLMEENAVFYLQLEKELIGADQPPSHPGIFQRFGERLHAMAIPSTMPGDLELNATSSVVEGRILVLDVNLRFIFLYGKDKFPKSPVYAVRYTRLGPDVGHYDAVILDLHYDDMLVQFAMQKIDQVDPSLNPSLQGFASLSINDDNNMDSTSVSTDDKSCQTPSDIFVACGNTRHREKNSDSVLSGLAERQNYPTEQEISCHNEKPKSMKALLCSKCQGPISNHSDHNTASPNRETKRAMDTSDDETKSVPNHQSSVTRSKKSTLQKHSSTTPKRDHGKEHSPKTISAANNSRCKSQIRGENSPSCGHGNSGGSHTSTKMARHPQEGNRKQSDSSFKEPERNATSHECESVILNSRGKREIKIRGRSLYRSRNSYKHKGNDPPRSSSEAGQKTMPKRKLHDCNENHKAVKSKKRKSSSNGTGEDNNTSTSKRKKSPTLTPTPVSKKRNIVYRIPRATGAPPKSNPTDVLPHIAPLFKPQMPPLMAPFQEEKKSCFVCKGAIPVSSVLGVQCFLCGKVGHRPCVRKHLNWNLDDVTDEYFLCQSCVPM